MTQPEQTPAIDLPRGETPELVASIPEPREGAISDGIESTTKTQSYQLAYEDNPLDFTDKSTLISEIGMLTSLAAEVFTDVESALRDVRYTGFRRQIEPKDIRYFEHHMSGISTIREAMTSASFCPEVVRGIWTDLINTSVDTTTTPRAEAEGGYSSVPEPYTPTPEDVMLIIDEVLVGWMGDARLVVECVENRFEERVKNEPCDERAGLTSAQASLIGLRNRVAQHIFKLPPRISSPALQPIVTRKNTDDTPLRRGIVETGYEF